LAEGVSELAIRNNFKGTFVEANAISPNTTRNIASKLAIANIICVDGGIIGGPAWNVDSNTHLYLSGTAASTIASLFKDSPLKSSVVDDKIGSASALKMTFAAYSKGTTALLAAILAVAEQEGVRDALQNQWGENFSQQTIARVTGNATKAWRFSGEMAEISKTFSDAGLPGEFHTGAAEVFRRLSDYKDVTTPPPLAEFLATLIDSK
jgi:3-hydroxyisobutyrate dehydrogenase-like beta-hydroxyacid dehydrogenase